MEINYTCRTVLEVAFVILIFDSRPFVLIKVDKHIFHLVMLAAYRTKW